MCVGVHAFEGVDNGECVMMMMCMYVGSSAHSTDAGCHECLRYVRLPETRRKRKRSWREVRV